MVTGSGELEVQGVGDELFALWAETDLTAASMCGGSTARIGTPLQAQSDEAASRARGWLARLLALDEASLKRHAELTRRYLRFEAGKLVDAAQLHSLDLQITPYRIGPTLAEVHRFMESFAFECDTDVVHYLELLRQYATFLTQTLQNLQEQASKGIVVPAAALPGCIRGMEVLSQSVVHYARVRPDRLQRIRRSARARLTTEIEAALEKLKTAFGAIAAFIRGDYSRNASSRIGIGQYPGGGDAYETLVRHYTTLGLTPEDVHHQGQELVREIEADMAQLRAELSFVGTGRAFLDRLRAEPRFYCDSPAAVEALFTALVRRCEAALTKAFGSRAVPPFAVKRLPPELEAGMTFGYYQPPVIGGDQCGYYLYNGSILDRRPSIGAASLVYHELIPGHHLHVAREVTDDARPAVRRFPTIAVFSEGSAEYAADLGFEMGLYDDPYDRYGRYLFQVFFASRLVVDTGLNALGWTSERARDYLLAHTAQSAQEIETEILRYGSSLPGQALVYALGRKQFWLLREAAQKQLGTDFQLPEFHDAILREGSLSLPDLRFSVDSWSRSANPTA
jgi:uncharacterized protein (DUF885 family)